MKPTILVPALLLATLSVPALAQEGGRPFNPARPPESIEIAPNNIQKDIKPTEPPPPYPAAKIEPLDTQLRAQARSIIESSLMSRDATVRANAVEAAQKALGAEARSHVVRALSDDAAIVRFAACIAAGDLRLAELRPQLLQLAYDERKDPADYDGSYLASVRLAARYALHRLGDTTLSQELINPGMLDHRKGVRANAVMLVGMLGEKSAIRPLTRLQERDSVVRLQAIEARWRLGDRSVLEDLVAASINAGRPGEQIVALIALAEPGDRSVLVHIRGLMVSEYPEVTLGAARSAAMLGSDEGYGLASKYAKSEDARQRGMAAQAFAEIGRSDSQSRLKPLLEDKDPNVQLAAATAVLRLKVNR